MEKNDSLYFLINRNRVSDIIKGRGIQEYNSPVHISLWGLHSLLSKYNANRDLFYQTDDGEYENQMEQFLLILFGDTMLDPFISHNGSDKSLIKKGKKRNASISDLFYGRIQLVVLSRSAMLSKQKQFRVDFLPGGGSEAWSDLLDYFVKNPEASLNSILNKAYKEKWINWEELSENDMECLVSTISHVYDSLNDVETKEHTRDICMRQLVLLCVEALLKENIWEDIAPKSYSLKEEEKKREEAKRAQNSKKTITLWVTTSYYLPPVLAADDGSFLGNTGGVFRPNLLANIKVGQKEYRLIIKEDGTYDSPLKQIISDNKRNRLFLLIGDTECGSTISGAGKTTAFKELQYSLSQGTILIPLNEVYSDYGHYYVGERLGGETQLMAYLRTTQRPYATFQDVQDTVLLLDALDEIVDNISGIRSFCYDLERLTNLASKQNLRIVISSKLPPNALSNWNTGDGKGLSNIAGIFHSALICKIQTMTQEQKRDVLKGSKITDALFEKLNSPFLLQSYGNMKSYVDEATEQKMSRWINKSRLKKTPETPEALIYRMLIAQICRWSAQDAAQDTRDEANAVFLLFSLPAIAHRQVISEISDPKFFDYLDDNVFRRTDEADNRFISEVLNLTLDMFGNLIPLLVAYRNENEWYLDVLRSAAEQSMLTKEGFDRSQASSILCRTHSGGLKRYSNYRFSNTALRFELSSLHIANVFFAAYHNLLTEDNITSLSLCFPFHMHSRKTLESVTHYLDELLWNEPNETISISNILKDGPGAYVKGKSTLNRYVLCRLASELCLPLKISEDAWIEESYQMYLALENEGSIVAKWEAWSFVVRIIGEKAKLQRKVHNYGEAEALARQTIRRCEDPKFPNIEFDYGFQMLSMDLQAQVQQLLNAKTDPENWNKQIPDEDLERADILFDLICSVNEYIAAGRGVLSSVYGERYKIDLSAENLIVIPPIFQVVDKAKRRLEAYQAIVSKRKNEPDVFDPRNVLKYLLEASYVAKAFSAYAALSTGTVGAALNKLGMFLQNQQEEMENASNLPFFQRHPELHMDEDALGFSLSYDNPYTGAFHVYQRIYNVRRGVQPYTSKVLSELILDGRIRFKEIVGSDGTVRSWTPFAATREDRERAFNQSEVAFLQETTSRAYESTSPASAIPRIRFLNLQFLSKEGEHIQEELEAKELFLIEWKRCGITRKLARRGKPDYYCALLIPESHSKWLPEALVNTDMIDKMSKYLRNALINSTIDYTTGMRVMRYHFELAAHRMERLESFIKLEASEQWKLLREDLLQKESEQNNQLTLRKT